MTDFPKKDVYTLSDLHRLTRLLRAPDGCPWDRVQTHSSIRRDFLEEAYEAVEAIDRDDPEMLCEELGDVLFQVDFHAVIVEVRERCSLDDIITGITRKMLTRHPHVFGDVTVSGEGEVLTNWEQIKNDSKGVHSASETLRLVPETFPALMKADKLIKRADKAGAAAGQKLAAGLDEACRNFQAAQDCDASQALGSLLLAVVAAAREKGVDAEMSLLEACKGLVERFESAEKLSEQKGLPLEETF